MVELEIKKKLDVVALAEKLNNVSEASRISGISRDTIHRHIKILKEKGPEGLKRQVNKDHYHKNRADRNLENVVINFSLENPHLGQVQVSRQLKEIYQIDISASGVRNIWLRGEMQTTGQRVHKSNALAATA